MDREICYRDQNCKIGHFNMGFYGHWLFFGAGLKWSFKELQFLVLLHWLHFSAPEIDVRVKLVQALQLLMGPDLWPDRKDIFLSLQEWTEEQQIRQNAQWTHAVQLSERFRWRQDFVQFTHLYKTGQNGKGDRLIVWRHFLKRVTLIQRSIMEYQYFIYCSCYTTFLYSVTCTW